MAPNSAEVLVTGAGGWIGRSVVARLSGRGIAVSCADRAISDSELSARAAASDVVVHAASGYSNSRSEFIDGGLRQVVAVARGCSKSDNSVVYLSSAKVYGWTTNDCDEPRYCEESSPCLGTDNFSTYKRLAEEILSRAARHAAVLRISNAYGYGIPAKYVIGKMLETAARDRRVILSCTGASLRDFVHLNDVVSVVESVTIDALRRKLPTPSTFNISSGQLMTMMDAATIVAQVIGAEVSVQNGPVISSPVLPNRCVIDAGYIDRFTDPFAGINSMLTEWKQKPWTLTLL